MADLYARYSCTYCQEEISGLRVRCAECSDFDICLQCFSVGAEIGCHKNDHAYQFMDAGAFGIFMGRGSWSANEEVRLLDAIEQFGFGNWEDIAKHIETRTPEEAKDEYIMRYLEGSIGRATWGTVESASRPSLRCVERDEGPLGPAALARLPPLAVTPDEAAQLGYMPNRDDFEREYDHEAEQIISSLSLSPEDDDLDIGGKLSHVDLYTRRLRERTRRKRIVRDYQLVSAFFSQQRNRQKTLTKMAKEKKELQERLRWVAQFYGRAEQTAFTESLFRERELRVRLSELYRYRLAGVVNVEECAHYEQHAAHRRHPHTAAAVNGSSGCPGSSQTSDQPSSSTPTKRSRDGESVSSSTSPRCTQDANTACGCSRKHLCSNGPSRNLLTDTELQLCNNFSLPPSHYITLKTVLLLKAGTDCEFDAVVRDYLQTAGWSNSPSLAPSSHHNSHR